MIYDLIIVGAGAAGLTAGIYASRRALSTLIISPDIGGQAALTNDVENYPGHGLVSGFDLMARFKESAEKFGCEIVIDEVTGIVIGENFTPPPTEETKGEKLFIVSTATGAVRQSRAVILAFGLTPRELLVPGEKEFRGKGVSYCATCDGPFFKGKEVAVAGGGPSALDAALYLSKICTKVNLVHYRDSFRGEKALEEKVREKKNIEIRLQQKIIKIEGDSRVKSLDIESVVRVGEKKQIAVEGVFVEIGYVAKTKWLGGLIRLNERNQIIIDQANRTNVLGIFAAGDVTTIPYKQIVVSAGEGAKAALEVYKYIQTMHGKAAVAAPDWGSKSS